MEFLLNLYNYYFGKETSPDVHLWTSPEELKPYYDFISKLKIAFDKAHGERPYNGFKDFPTPGGCRCRTPDSIYLEMEEFGKMKLWTPFGEIILLHGGMLSDVLEEIGQKFMKELELEDVSSKVRFYAFADGKEYPKEISGKFYLLKGMKVPCSYKLYNYVKDDWKKDDEIFEIVSKGKNAF